MFLQTSILNCGHLYIQMIPGLGYFTKGKQHLKNGHQKCFFVFCVFPFLHSLDLYCDPIKGFQTPGRETLA